MTKTCFSCGEQFEGREDVCGRCQNQRAKIRTHAILSLPLSQLSEAEKRVKAEYIKNHIDEMAAEYERFNSVYKPNRFVLWSAKIFIWFMTFAMFAPFYMWIVGLL